MRRMKTIVLVLMAALLLSGCATVDDMYAIPKRSQDYNDLQVSIDKAMTNLSYSAPVAGENRQSVQMADLDGDGTAEYLVFAKDSNERPLKILVFRNVDGRYDHVDTLESNGTAFDQVEYVQLDEKPGLEIVIGRQVSDQVFRSMTVYTMDSGKVTQVISDNYTKLLPVDMNGDGTGELFLIKPGQTDADKGVISLYGVRNGVLERSNEADMSQPADRIKRIISGKLQNGGNAVYIASTVDESTLITDVFVLHDGLMTNMTLSVESGTSVKTMRNYYIYADDVDDDGVVELPALLNMKPVSSQTNSDQLHLIRWYALTASGEEKDKMYTFHNFLDGWYLQLEEDLVNRITVTMDSGVYRFCVWDTDFKNTEELLRITTHSAQSLTEQEGAVVLTRTDAVVYTAILTPYAEKYGITQESVVYNFRLIHQDWKTGET
ncbi:MAG: hypothetical protein IKU57_01335 [Oscillospiraceae bacterium]|nr:hypothetical protein [Oscillospiraceae bacterium]